MWEIDRSGILSAQKCPRDRYWSRHYQGTGIERKRRSLPLAFGSAFHDGAEALLKGDVEGAVAKAKLYLELAFSVESVDVEEKEVKYALGEQIAIAEGLLRGWWAFDGERFLRDFEVLEVEQEGRATLKHGAQYHLVDSRPSDVPDVESVDTYRVVGSGDEMVLMFRPDALVRERLTGDLYIVSWKTASTFGQYTINQINSDMQSISEVWGVQQSYRETALSVAGGHADDAKADFGELKIEGCLYLFCVKGQRKLDDYLGFKVQNTPLAYGWVRKGPTPDEDEWAWTYGWATEEMNPKTMKLVQTKLGKGFRKVPIWTDYPGGVKAWIDDLAAQQIEPRHINALEGVFPQSMPVSRRADEIESWRRQTVAAEKRIQEAAALMDYEVAENGSAQFVETLDETFPQSTQRCFDYMSRCQFFEACFTPAVKADPLGSGLYSIRVPNHPTEKGSNDAE